MVFLGKEFQKSLSNLMGQHRTVSTPPPNQRGDSLRSQGGAREGLAKGRFHNKLRIMTLPRAESNTLNRVFFLSRFAMLLLFLLPLVGCEREEFSVGEILEIPVAQVNATDGDGLRFDRDETRYRLWGIDALERDQYCFDPERYPCGEEATRALQKLLRAHSNATLTCEVKVAPNKNTRLRPMVQCFINELDIARYLVQKGQAIRKDKLYKEAEEQAKEHKSGMWAYDCSEKPEDYRARKGEPKDEKKEKKKQKAEKKLKDCIDELSKSKQEQEQSEKVFRLP